jgi:PTS system mannose-specific IID component
LKKALLSAFFRSFFIQGCWNFEGMQNVGFAFGISPVIMEVFKNKRERSTALLRSLELFNTHPYMATAILGATAKMEWEVSESGGVGQDISGMKDMLSGPLAGIGDTFFWATLKPLFSITAVISGFLGGLIAPIIFLLLYNSIHIWMRIKGFLMGLKKGIDLVDFVHRVKLPVVTEGLRGFIVIITGVLIAGLSFFAPVFLGWEDWGLWGELRVFIVIPFALLIFLAKRNVPLLLMLYVFTILSIAGYSLFI